MTPDALAGRPRDLIAEAEGADLPLDEIAGQFKVGEAVEATGLRWISCIGVIERVTADSVIVRQPCGGTTELLFEHVRRCDPMYEHLTRPSAARCAPVPVVRG